MSAYEPLRLAVNSNNVVELRGLRNTITNALDTGATVLLTIRDAAGIPVSGQTWPATLAHASRGLYRVTLEAAVAIDPLQNYEATIVAVGSGGEQRTWVRPVESYVG